MGTKKIIEEAWTGEDLCNKTTYAINEIPVETSPRNKVAKKVFSDRSNEKDCGSDRNKGIEKTKPDSIVAEARADEFIWFNLNKTLFEYA